MRPSRAGALALLALLLVIGMPLGAVETGPGDDLAAAFGRARAGAPLRYVAIGGSITQAGNGWLGPWLRERFPASAVTSINAGMSATGSTLGMFRLERDVIAHQPDVVAIEFCVNDGGEDDGLVVRALETLVVRLKRLPHPPAVFFVEAAARNGVHAARHRRVAAHYGLLSVDLQAAVKRETDAGVPWDELFSDDVHPRDAGHAVYARALAEALAPFTGRAPADPATERALPAPLGALPLLLDARLVPLVAQEQAGWRALPAPPEWWGRFFQGLLQADAPGSVLNLRVRGTSFGLLHILDGSHGRLLVGIDGAVPSLLALDGRSGYAASMIGMDLPPGEHAIACALPEPSGVALGTGRGTTVQLGYLLVAGDDGSTTAPVPGPWDAPALAGLRFAPVAAGSWSWAGPYASDQATGIDAAPAMREAFPPERSPSTVTWSPLPPSTGDWIDLAAVRRGAAPAVVYATATVESDGDRRALMAFAADYFAQVWVNDQPMLMLDGGHGPPRQPLLVPIVLRKGSNALRVKVGSGSGGFGFALAIQR